MSRVQVLPLLPSFNLNTDCIDSSAERPMQVWPELPEADFHSISQCRRHQELPSEGLAGSCGSEGRGVRRGNMSHGGW